MANQEQLEILKQGVEVWEAWREENPDVNIDLSEADLVGVNLMRANLSEANLWGANLRGASLAGALLARANLNEADLTEAKLSGANLCDAHLNEADLIQANLSGANLTGAKLRAADLSFADLSHAHLNKVDLNFTGLRGAKLIGTDLTEASTVQGSFWQADLSEANLNQANLTRATLNETNFGGAKLTHANLSGANLSRAGLTHANLNGAYLVGSNFSNTVMFDTIFGDSDLSKAKGLEDVVHGGPSNISTETFVRSKGKIPEAFLRGCGLSDWEIELVKLYNPDLSNDEFINIQNRIFDLRQRQALQISSLFISYSHGDGTFVDKLESHLNKEGIRFWRDVHDAKAGRLEKQIDRAMRLNPTVLLILSENSIKSDWVEHEVRTARELEKEMGRDVLCPVALDDSWKDSSWPKRVMEQVMEYNILDFSAWKDDSKFGNTSIN